MRGKPQTFQGFTAGINLADAPYMLGEKECRDARNVIATGRGAIRKRPGNQLLARLAGQPKSLFAMQTPDLLVAQVGGELFDVSAGGGVTLRAGGLDGSALWEWIQGASSGGQGPAYGMNGVNPPKYHTGAVISDWTAASGTLPNGRFLRYAQNRVIVSGELANPSRVYASKIQDPRVFAAPDGWAVDLDVADGRSITALGTIGPYVLAFKDSKTWAIYDVDTGANRRLSDSIGCVAPRSVVETPVGTFFLSRDAIYRTDGSEIKDISTRIRPLIEAIPASRRRFAAGVFLDGHYYLAISSAGSAVNDLLLDFDTVNDAWWIHTCGAAQLVVWTVNDDAHIYGAREADIPRVERLFVPGEYVDSGDVFLSYWAGPYHAFGAPHLRKRVRQVHFDGLGLIEVRLSKDFESSVELEKAVDFGAGALVEEAKIYTPGVARTWSVIFGNESADNFEIDSYTMAIDVRTN